MVGEGRWKVHMDDGPEVMIDPADFDEVEWDEGESCFKVRKTRERVLGSLELDSIVGEWQDNKGSRYKVTPCAPGSLTVVTTRPTGQVWRTEGLIHLRCPRILWGLGSNCFELRVVSSNALSWGRGAAPVFLWTRCSATVPVF